MMEFIKVNARVLMVINFSAFHVFIFLIESGKLIVDN